MGKGIYCVPHDRYYGIFPCSLCEKKRMANNLTQAAWWRTLLSADVHSGPSGKKLGATHWKPMPSAPLSSKERGDG